MAVKSRFAAMCLIAIGAPMTAATPIAAADPVATTPAGAVRGITMGDERVFRGIPYALPPIGQRRWTAPVDVPPWRGELDATGFGPACQQPAAPAGSIYAETYPTMSEDCLSLNVWTPAGADGKTPVFVWIHGGNLIRGASRQGLFDGANLAKRGIVVVSINYRLGVFGYLAHPELSAESPDGISGNYGLLDQIAALHWVKRNISAFGGDPHQVTVAGESAGGLAILHLLGSPRARGLFHRAIVQSASLMNIPELKHDRYGLPSAESTGRRVAAAARAADIGALRAVDPGRLMAIAAGAGFAPTAIVDGKLLPHQLIETFERGEQAPVPLLTGFTAGEIRTMRTILPGLPDAAALDAARYTDTIRRNYGELADSFLRLYPATDIAESILAAARDGFFAWTSQRLVREQAVRGLPAYLYQFDHGYPAADAGGMHAFHASEVPYVFGSIRNVTSLWPAIPDTPREQALSDAMADYWASFARTGTPLAANQPIWPPYNERGDYMLFAGTPRVVSNLKPEEYRLHDEVICRRRAAGGIPWNWNVGVTSPALPPPAGACR